MLTHSLFYLFATALLLGGSGVIFLRNPVYAVLCLIIVFFNTAGLFLLLGAEFLAMLLVIVYVGAVAILFLFIVMTLDIQNEVAQKNTVKGRKGAFFCILLFASELLCIAYNWWESPDSIDLAAYEIPANITNTEAIGDLLYTHYFLVFIVSGLTLLVAMVGSIVLTSPSAVKNTRRKTDPRSQIMRTKKESIILARPEFHKGVEI
ncbi:MAG: NADH-quinone oxidoreductase subunit J [Alphaproteobacteria bacterium]|nr:NADH-quinone oxidoreductase subunit J [Alphaproteobacteria bacterium]